MNGHKHHLVINITFVTFYVGHQRDLLKEINEIDMLAHAFLPLSFNKALKG